MIETDNPTVYSRKGYDLRPRFTITDASTGKPMRFEATDVIRASILDGDEVRIVGLASDATPPTASIVNLDGGLIELDISRAVVALVPTPASARWIETYLVRAGLVSKLAVAPLELGPDITV